MTEQKKNGNSILITTPRLPSVPQPGKPNPSQLLRFGTCFKQHLVTAAPTTEGAPGAASQTDGRQLANVIGD